LVFDGEEFDELGCVSVGTLGHVLVVAGLNLEQQQKSPADEPGFLLR
jgi:hypothetical protein